MRNPVRVNRLGAALAAIVALAVLVGVSGSPGAGAAATSSPAISFSHGRLVDIQRLGAEPEIKIDSKNNVYVTAPIGVQYLHSFLWKSEDGGDSFDLLRAFPPTQRPMPSAGTGDATMAIVPGPAGSTQDAVVWSDMVNLAGIANAATFDGGNTFPPDYWNLFASDPGADRQWLAGTVLPGSNTVRIYQFYDQVDIGGNSIIYSDDYGKSWVTANRDDGLGSPNPGNIAVDPIHGKLYAATVSGAQAIVSVCDLNGQNCEEKTAGTGKGDLANLFDVVSVDTAGNVYLAFTEAGGTQATYLSVSTNQGQTWRQTRVSPVDQGATVFPWVVAGDPGRVWVTWYGTANKADVSSNTGPWDVYGAQSLNALDTTSSFQVVKISEHPNHDNAVCLSGIACTAGQVEDRNMLDDFTAAIDRQGMLHVAYNDTNNQVTASTDTEAGGAFIIEAKQLSGPSLYASVGSVAPTAPAPEVSSTSVSGGTLQVAGRHTLPAGNWGPDPGGDALDPRHGSGGPGPNNTALDLRSVWLEQATDGGIVAHLDVNGLPATPEQATVAAGGKTVMYQVFFWVGGKIFFAAVESTGAGEVAYAGVPIGVINTGGIVKIATYQPIPGRTLPVPAQWHGGSPGHIDITIPATVTGAIAPGTRLDQVTAFVQTMNGPPGAEALMDERDATPATSWVAGDTRSPAGSVQLSIDDPSFTLPVTATLSDYPGPNWSASLPVTGLAAGSHTLYVRQVVNGFPGVSIAVAFTV